MAVSEDILIEVIQKEIEEKYGEKEGEALSMLFFGKGGIPGLIHGAKLTDCAIKQHSAECTDEVVKDLIADAITEQIKAVIAELFPALLGEEVLAILLPVAISKAVKAAINHTVNQPGENQSGGFQETLSPGDTSSPGSANIGSDLGSAISHSTSGFPGGPGQIGTGGNGEGFGGQGGSGGTSDTQSGDSCSPPPGGECITVTPGNSSGGSNSGGGSTFHPPGDIEPPEEPETAAHRPPDDTETVGNSSNATALDDADNVVNSVSLNIINEFKNYVIKSFRIIYGNDGINYSKCLFGNNAGTNGLLTTAKISDGLSSFNEGNISRDAVALVIKKGMTDGIAQLIQKSVPGLFPQGQYTVEYVISVVWELLPDFLSHLPPYPIPDYMWPIPPVSNTGHSDRPGERRIPN